MPDTATSSPVDSARLTQAYRSRQQRLQGCLAEHQIEGLLISAPRDICYLTGFHGDESLALVTDSGAWVISDSRFEDELALWADQATGAGIIMGIRHQLNEALCDHLDREKIKRLGVQAESMTVAAMEELVRSLSPHGFGVTAVAGLISGMQRIKDETEIELISHAIDIQQRALGEALSLLKIGMTEHAFAAELEYAMRRLGASGPGFSTIVASGANSALCHHAADETPIDAGVLLIDWGAAALGYNGDLTRTYAIGTMPSPLDEIYQIVLEAQLAGIAACQPGVFCAEVDQAARQVIEEAGYGDQFIHGLGHGLGRQVHEGPYFNNLEVETALEPGMVMTVEPGIYLPGIGGVRIEDDVLITASGHRVLSDMKKELQVLEPGTV